MQLEIYRHKKRGTYYQIIGEASLYTLYPNEIADGCVMSFYISVEGGSIVVTEKDYLQVADPEHISLGTVNFQRAASTSLRLGSSIIVYRAKDGTLWGRQKDEFLDGRFELVRLTETRPLYISSLSEGVSYVG